MVLQVLSLFHMINFLESPFDDQYCCFWSFVASWLCRNIVWCVFSGMSKLISYLKKGCGRSLIFVLCFFKQFYLSICVQLAELWPNGYMDNRGIKRAICRAKERRKALYIRHKVCLWRWIINVNVGEATLDVFIVKEKRKIFGGETMCIFLKINISFCGRLILNKYKKIVSWRNSVV